MAKTPGKEITGAEITESLQRGVARLISLPAATLDEYRSDLSEIDDVLHAVADQAHGLVPEDLK